MSLDSLNRSGVQTSNPALYDTLKGLLDFQNTQNTKKSSSGLLFDPSTLAPGLGSILFNTGSDLLFKSAWQTMTVTDVGVFNNYNPGVDLNSNIIFQVNNANTLTINGFFVGFPGQIIILRGVNNQVNLGHFTGGTSDTKLINNITSGPTPVCIRGYAIYMYVANPLFGGENTWLLIGHQQGSPLGWNLVFTGSGTLTFTGVTGNATFQVIHNRVFLNFFSLAGNVAGAGSIINFNLPNGFTAAQSNIVPTIVNPAGVGTEVEFLNATTGSNNMILERFAGVAYPVGTTTFFFDIGVPIN